MTLTSQELLDRARRLKVKLSNARASLIREINHESLWTLVEDCASNLKNIAPITRRQWLEYVVREIYDNQGGTCTICTLPMLFDDINVDHVIPFSWGGGNERANIQVVHSHCNKQKSNRVDAIELLIYLEDRYMNLPANP